MADTRPPDQQAAQGVVAGPGGPGQRPAPSRVGHPRDSVYGALRSVLGGGHEPPEPPASHVAGTGLTGAAPRPVIGQCLTVWDATER